MKTDVFKKINDAVLDLQRSQYQTYELPVKRLGKLLSDPSLKEINDRLTSGVDLERFLEKSEASRRGYGESIEWPDDEEERLALILLLLQGFYEDPKQAVNFCHRWFGGGSKKIIAGIHNFTSQVVIPFARDYEEYVRSGGEAEVQITTTFSDKVFIVHGHDKLALESLARFLEKLGLEATILQEVPNQGKTLIEKFEGASNVGYAVVLLTPDDVGAAVSASDSNVRARQNVVFELGYFVGKLGRGKVCLLKKGDVEIPSDLAGVVYTDIDDAGGWKIKLVTELRAANMKLNLEGIF